MNSHSASALHPPGRGEIDAARQRIKGIALRTPLIRLPSRQGEREIWLKLELLQPIGSFKIRGAANAMGLLTASQLADGVYTASAGNMAQGVAWCALQAGVPCTVIVPDSAPQAKVEAIRRLKASVIAVPHTRWWQTLVERQYPGQHGHFIHPVSDQGVVAGNATIGDEIIEELPDTASVIVPYGGGGLSCGIAAAMLAANADIPVFASEVDTAAPLVAALRNDGPTPIEHHTSFVDGIGGRAVLEEMWPMARTLLAGSCVVSLEQVCDGVRALVSRSRVVAEGAGATAIATALHTQQATGLGGRGVELPPGPMVCVISGGNIDPTILATILEGGSP